MCKFKRSIVKISVLLRLAFQYPSLRVSAFLCFPFIRCAIGGCVKPQGPSRSHTYSCTVMHVCSYAWGAREGTVFPNQLRVLGLADFLVRNGYKVSGCSVSAFSSMLEFSISSTLHILNRGRADIRARWLMNVAGYTCSCFNISIWIGKN